MAVLKTKVSTRDERFKQNQAAMAEIVAVIFAVLYLLLAIRQNIWCWYCAAISTAIFIFVYFSANLYMEALLNVFYFGMAVYGWRQWSSTGDTASNLPVTTWSERTHFTAIAAILMLSIVSGFLLTQFTDAAYPYIDSATTYAAVWATYLVARKVLENWWYWLVIDIVSVFIYWSRDLELTAVLFVLYVALIPMGIVSWTRSYRSINNTAAAPA